jgi:hypothetical protein
MTGRACPDKKIYFCKAKTDASGLQCTIFSIGNTYIIINVRDGAGFKNKLMGVMVYF